MKDVIISIKGDQYQDENGSAVEFVTDGQYLWSGDKAMFNYMESQLTGMDGTITTVEVGKGTASINRTGAVTMNMLFEEGRKHYFMYETQFGAMSMGLETNNIRSTLGEHGGDLEIHYVLNLENTQLSRNTFKINVKEA